MPQFAAAPVAAAICGRTGLFETAITACPPTKYHHSASRFFTKRHDNATTLQALGEIARMVVGLEVRNAGAAGAALDGSGVRVMGVFGFVWGFCAT